VWAPINWQLADPAAADDAGVRGNGTGCSTMSWAAAEGKRRRESEEAKR